MSRRAPSRVAAGSNCPSSKSIVVRLDPRSDGAGSEAGRVESGGHKRTPDPDQQA